jgi:hypothetical protein
MIPRTTADVRIFAKTSCPVSSKARVKILSRGKTTIKRRRNTARIKVVLVPISNLMPFFFFNGEVFFSSIAVVVMIEPLDSQ